MLIRQAMHVTVYRHFYLSVNSAFSMSVCLFIHLPVSHVCLSVSHVWTLLSTHFIFLNCVEEEEEEGEQI